MGLLPGQAESSEDICLTARATNRLSRADLCESMLIESEAAGQRVGAHGDIEGVTAREVENCIGGTPREASQEDPGDERVRLGVEKSRGTCGHRGREPP